MRVILCLRRVGSTMGDGAMGGDIKCGAGGRGFIHVAGESQGILLRFPSHKSVFKHER